MVVQKRTVYAMLLCVLCTIFFIIGLDCNNQTFSCLFLYFIICATGIVIIVSMVACFKVGEILSPIFVANFFSAFVFIARPIQILLSQENINRIYAIGMYSRIGNKLSFEDLPILQASYIGFLGVLFMNLFYFGIKTSLDRSKLSNYHEVSVYDSNRALSTKQFLTILVVMCPAIISMGSFIIKQMVLGAAISMIDIVWIYILCALIIYLIAFKRKATSFIYILIFISALVLGIASKRMYIVNLIICFIVPLYYLGEDRRKNIKRVLIMVFILFCLVLVYGSIRAGRIGATQGTVIEQFLDEFCMYDMLLVSIRHCNANNIGLFWGYNFLTVFTTIIPGVRISQFDHELTKIVFSGLFKGGIPVTIFGSFYLNFSYIGVAIGAALVGAFFRYLRNKCTRTVNIKGIMYYTIFTTFAYDVIRVGDIGREIWTCIIMILVAKIFMFVVPCDDIGEKYE